MTTSSLSRISTALARSSTTRAYGHVANHLLRQQRKSLKRLARTVVLFQEEGCRSKRDERERTERSFLFQAALLTPQGEELLFRLLGYYREQQRWHLVQVEQVRSQWRARRHQQGADAAGRMIEHTREVLVESNLRLAAAAARKYANERLSFDELFSDATMILLKTIDLFDPDRGFRFSTYFVNAAMRHLHKVRNRASNVRIDLLSAEPEYFSQLAETPSVDETEHDEEQVLGGRFNVQAKKVLPERHYFVMARRCGLDGTDGKVSFESIGNELGVSKERARQLFNEAVDRLRSEFVPSKC